jgi:L-amino acid N-acyltransferase YncA
VTIESIRPAVEGDLVTISEIYDHYVLTSHATFDIEPVGIDHRREWLEGHSGFRCAAHFSEQGRKFGRYWDVDWYERPVGETEAFTAPA